MKIQCPYRFSDVISIDNLLAAWQEFALGKRGKRDVQEFSLRLIDNIVQLHEELANGAYRHGGYTTFFVNDPKRRHIHKASARDRLLHHATYRLLYPFFDRTFTADSFSCRVGKGTHRALDRFRRMAYEVSQNHTRTCWVLKGDIRRCFDSIDHAFLRGILAEYIPNPRLRVLLDQIIGSFDASPGKGLPLGNLTSQLFVNVYLNVFDQFVKHRLKAKHYIRYADDFVIFSRDRKRLVDLIPRLQAFLQDRLRLTLPSGKLSICTVASGIDFLGWVHFPHHRVLRRATKRRMFRRIREHAVPTTLQSYLGLLRHGATFRLQQQVKNEAWLWGQPDEEDPFP